MLKKNNNFRKKWKKNEGKTDEKLKKNNNFRKKEKRKKNEGKLLRG